MIRLVLLLVSLLSALPATADSWQLRQRDDKRDIRVYLRDRPGSAYDDVYAVTRLAANRAQVEAVLGDVAALSQWAPHVQQARLIKRQPTQAWIYLRYHLPYPFKPRDVVVLTQRSVQDDVVNIRSTAVKGYVREDGQSIRLHNLTTTWRLTELPDGDVRIELWGSSEPGGLIPAMLYNYNLAPDAQQTLRQLRRMILRDKYRTHPADAPDEG